MAQMLRFTSLGSVMPQSVAATMSQCSKALANSTALLRIVAQPVQQLGESPLMGVDPAAPLDRFQLFAVGELGNLLRLALGAMVAPQIVVIERLHACVDRHHARAGGIERDGLDLLARNSRLGQHRPHGADQRIHLILMRLGGEIRVFPLTLQRIFGRRRGQTTLLLSARPLSNSVTRTLSVPKSTPATIATAASSPYVLRRQSRSWLYMLQPR